MLLFDDDNDDSLRWLTQVHSTTPNNSTKTAILQDSAILRDMGIVYGSLLVIVFFVFCYVRITFPRPYTIRKWKEEFQSPLAQNQFGFVSWIWMLFRFQDDELAEHCGLDAVCFLRTLAMGKKLCMVGMFNALWLVPIYATAESSPETDKITDWVVRITLSHVPPGSARLVATVLAAYVSFGYTMYLIVQEFEWFIGMRHKFLRKPRPRNYTVYVSNIPPEIRSNQKLESFFRHCFNGDPVVDARIRVVANKLSGLVTKRDHVIAQLEHALAVEDKTGTAPTRNTGLVGGIPGVGSAAGAIPVLGSAVAGERVNSIEFFSRELAELNADISYRILLVETMLSETAAAESLEEFNPSSKRSQGPFDTEENGTESDDLITPETRAEEKMESDSIDTPHSFDPLSRPEGPEEEQSTENRSYSQKTSNNNSLHGTSAQSVHNDSSRSAMSLASGATKKATKAVGTVIGNAKGASKLATHAVGSAVKMVAGAKDYEHYYGGFVSFRTLSLKYAALQMLHHGTPSFMTVSEAPDPQDVFWANVGREYKELQLGQLLSRAASVAICFLWTFPMTIIASLSTVEGLKRQFDIVEDAIEAFPALEPILQQLAPLLIVLSNVVLRQILKALSMWEGPVSGSVVEALTFTKLATFMIIQTFFVTAISGSLLEEIKQIAEDPLILAEICGTARYRKGTRQNFPRPPAFG
ncbi:hypothetical protein FisN_31Lu081 [Fistulifera solaris]|uniref:CSC1/OSCA1-like 7TM region domain-containing protein n=1 Tax=Fistulifera solaris TaxID=1519565 RepID=A0A1Z5K6B0_FISSO|nr:hypothetical protein FisN_31Lu081 [Fistulifera solaris]|eukprot:GAX21790.1 hypothetical protein FisN_31Lu081 [Fistulifera solaris]